MGWRWVAAPGAVRWGLPIAVLIGCSAYVLSSLHSGWVPHDEGTLAHSAERVLSGELPHRDFGDTYTGGLAYLHAAALDLLGMNLRSIRWSFFGFVVLWIPALYYIARWFVGHGLAALAVLVAVAWSVPNYSAAMPSWYNLILATFAMAALLRHLGTGHRRWVVVAGVFSGASILVKVVGIYFVAAVLLFFAFHEQAIDGDRPPRRAGRSYSWLLTGTLALFVAGLLLMASRLSGSGSLFHFALPGAAVATLVAWREWSNDPRADLPARVGALVRLGGPFLLGVLLPVTGFVAMYIASGAVGDLVAGVFVKPAARLTFASVPPSAVGAAGPAVVVIVLVAGERWLDARERWFAATALLLLGGMLVWQGGDVWPYRLVWASVRPIIPLLVVAGALRLARVYRPDDRARTSGVFLVLSTVALFSLIQFPFSAPVYFLYVAPLVVLAALAGDSGSDRRPVFAVVLAFYLVFAVRWLNTGFIYQMGQSYVRSDQTATLALERGKLRVSPVEKAEYERVVELLRAHASGGYIFATPDSPEVYFLAGLRNPTGILYDFLEEPLGRTERVLAALDRRRVEVIAINTTPGFTVHPDRIDGVPFSPPDTALITRLEERYPNAALAGSFIVRWRE